MSRLPLLVLVTALVAVAAAVGLARALETPATREEQAHALAAELRCPDCQALSVADSSTRAAVEIRRQISAQLAAGRSPDEVRQHFVDRYGDWILLAPRSPVAWVLPALVVPLGLLGLGIWLAGARRRAARPTATVPDAARRAVREEAEALDA